MRTTTTTRARRSTTGAGLALATGLALTACAGSTPETDPAPASSPVTEAPATGEAGPSPASGPVVEGAVTVSGSPVTVATALAAPWSVVPLDSGSSFASLRDEGRVVEILEDGSTREVAVVDDVEPRGEGGLLGLAVLGGSPSYLYAYVTTAADNRVVRMPVTGEAGSYGLGERQDVLTGIPVASNHDGGRIAFGPDGMLYVTTGDASVTANAQDPGSLGGKILRLTPEGDVPADNPMPGSPVWSSGHRNPQGITWTADGTMWAAEFGQDTWDELNRVVPGADFGWPDVEGGLDDAAAPGAVDDEGRTAPVLQWRTDVASPSALTAVGDTLYLAGLGGERLFEIQVDDAGTATATELLTGDDSLGRLRDVVPAPDGGLWIVTNNTDGRGDPRSGDDQVVRVPLSPAA